MQNGLSRFASDWTLEPISMDDADESVRGIWFFDYLAVFLSELPYVQIVIMRMKYPPDEALSILLSTIYLFFWFGSG